MRVLVFRHEPSVHLGNIAPVLRTRGFDPETIDLYAGAALPDPTAADGLIFLGGAMCPNDDFEFLRRELAVIREAAERGQPVFGVCLGGQMVAKALGAKVHRNPVPETGWHPVELDPAAARDPVFQHLDAAPRVFQLHQDTFDLPAGATRLAASVDCANQAFRWGRAVYGVQFHPEMTEEMIEDWSLDLNLPRWEETPASCARLARQCERLFAGWLGLLR